MKVQFRVMVLMCSAALSGCGAPLITYSGKPKSPDSIATVERGVVTVAGQDYYTFFSSYAKQNAGDKLVFTSTTGMPSELKMLPGDYVLMMRCDVGEKEAISPIFIKVEAGSTYQVLCRPVPDQLNKIHTYVKKVDSE